MKTKLVFTSKKPLFAISCDRFQWILSRRRDSKSWRDNSYHPNLTNLLDELAEYMFKKNANKLKELHGLDKAIVKTYDLITKVSKVLEKRLTSGTVAHHRDVFSKLVAMDRPKAK